MADSLAAERAEQAFRPVALTYASLTVDAAAVSTGRRAIVRSIYARFGAHDDHNLSAMLDPVIAREEAAARSDAQRTP